MSRSYSHLNGTYIFNRVCWAIDQKLRPDDPWITRQAINILNSMLKKSDVGVEFGSGRSTRWFAARMAKLTSIEHNKEWYLKVANDIADFTNVDYRHIDVSGNEGSGEDQIYAALLQESEDASLDFVLVDGVYRETCMLNAIDKIKIGGLLVLDNANWYLPCKSISPNSRTFEDGPLSDNWGKIENRLSSWRKIWTTNHVSDTAIFIHT